MKILCLFLSLLIVFSFIVSCDKVEDTPEVTTTGVTTTAATTTTTAVTTYPPDLKTTSAFDGIDIKPGMDVTILRDLIITQKTPGVTRFCNYYMFTNSSYENVVIQVGLYFSDVIRVEKFPWASAKDLSGIKNGMSFFDVVELIGIPASDSNSSVITYNTPDGEKTINFVSKTYSFNGVMYVSDANYSPADESMIPTTTAFDGFDLKPGPVPSGFFSKYNDYDPAIVEYLLGYQQANFVFFTNTNKEIVVVELSDDLKEILRVEKYSWRAAERFSEYNEDMDAFEIVELLGMPTCTSGSGFRTLVYQTPYNYLSIRL